MNVSINNIYKAFAVGAVIALLVSCASYNHRIGNYYTQMVNGEYAAASASLDKNKL